MDILPPSLGGNGQDRLMACIASNPLLFWIPKIMNKNSSYIAHFAKQGFGLFVISAFFNFLPFRSLAYLIVTICMAYLAYHAYKGNKVIIPYYTENLENILKQLGIHTWFETK